MIFIAFLFSFLAQADSYDSIYTKRVALVIGVWDYTEWKKLPGVEKDFPRVVEAFEKVGFEVTPLENPTKDELEDGVLNFILDNNFTAGRIQILIYYAGHGIKKEAGYLIPVDGTRKSNQNSRGGSSTIPELTWVPNSLITDYITNSGTNIEHKLAIFDSCYSGDLVKMGTRSQRETLDDFELNYANNSAQFISSSNDKQEAKDASAFTSILLSVMNPSNPNYAAEYEDNFLTAHEFFLVVQRKMDDNSQSSQDPMFGEKKGGEFWTEYGDNILVEKEVLLGQPTLHYEIHLTKTQKRKKAEEDLKWRTEWEKEKIEKEASNKKFYNWQSVDFKSHIPTMVGIGVGGLGALCGSVTYNQVGTGTVDQQTLDINHACVITGVAGFTLGTVSFLLNK
jgi:hypothetical protein